VRRSHDGDLISVWKGDRSEHTTLRATARRCLDLFHDPRLYFRATKSQIERAMRGHVLANAELIGTYQKGDR
jgi:hypothetical protein